ncbi:fumarylacetoacetate hydrolase family protein [Neisseria sp. Ec49-e6-T10]|uniref:fumarylacetoacetate hydrolase family protein n=1 Tax=Neisseria sp. Ec49-e6-T10 TaxID=3140744 RepID=UPI003EBAE3CE
MDYIFTPPEITSIPVFGTQKQFAVRHIYCVGRNYASHAREMGSDPNKEPPFFFMKPSDSIVCAQDNTSLSLPYPTKTQDFQHEVELVVALGKEANAVCVEEAKECIFGYAIGLDMTRRDLQTQMKAGGRPWEIGKAFDASAPISQIYPASEVGYPEQGQISIQVNGQLKQTGNLNEMIWSIPETISYLSQFFVLKAGDLIFTGTPEGVAPVKINDQLVAHIEGLGQLSVHITG